MEDDNVITHIDLDHIRLVHKKLAEETPKHRRERMRKMRERIDEIFAKNALEIVDRTPTTGEFQVTFVPRRSNDTGNAPAALVPPEPEAPDALPF